MVVGVGEGARGALGHRGDRYPVRGREPCPAESAHWWGGHAAYYGRVGPRLVRMVRLPSGFPPGTIKRRSAPDPILRTPRVGIPIWYGSEGLHQAVAPAIGV